MTQRIGLFPSFFIFDDTPTPEIYTLSLHDALPIFSAIASPLLPTEAAPMGHTRTVPVASARSRTNLVTAALSFRSEEHTSELQSRFDLVCRLLLEKKK